MNRGHVKILINAAASYRRAVVVFFVLVMADRNWRLEISLIAFIEAVVDMITGNGITRIVDK